MKNNGGKQQWVIGREVATLIERGVLDIAGALPIAHPVPGSYALASVCFACIHMYLRPFSKDITWVVRYLTIQAKGQKCWEFMPQGLTRNIKSAHLPYLKVE